MRPGCKFRCPLQGDVSISYGAFGSLRLARGGTDRLAEVHVSISYGAFGSLRPNWGSLADHDRARFNLLRSIRFIATATIKALDTPLSLFQSPTEHSVHCDRASPHAAGGATTFQSPTEHSVHCDGSARLASLPLNSFQSPTEHSVHCDFPPLNGLMPVADVSISYGAFGSLRPVSVNSFVCTRRVFQSPTEHSVHCDSRMRSVIGEKEKFQSPTEHSVHCDIYARCTRHPHPMSFNLLRSIRFIATSLLVGGDERH